VNEGWEAVKPAGEVNRNAWEPAPDRQVTAFTQTNRISRSTYTTSLS